MNIDECIEGTRVRYVGTKTKRLVGETGTIFGWDDIRECIGVNFDNDYKKYVYPSNLMKLDNFSIDKLKELV